MKVVFYLFTADSDDKMGKDTCALSTLRLPNAIAKEAKLDSNREENSHKGQYPRTE